MSLTELRLEAMYLHEIEALLVQIFFCCCLVLDSTAILLSALRYWQEHHIGVIGWLVGNVYI